MAARRTAARDEIAVARIETFIDRNVLNRGDHVLIGGDVDRIGRLLD